MSDTEHTAEKDTLWSCPDCPWQHAAHPAYGWSKADDQAVEVHRTMLCSARDIPPGEGRA
jgi:hypothetical protein